MIHAIEPFAQANATWLGLGDDGHRRKVFTVDQHINASEFRVRHQHVDTGREPLWPSSTARTATCPST